MRNILYVFPEGNACRGLSMHKAENPSGEIRSSVPCILLQTKTEEGKGQKTVTWTSGIGRLNPEA